MTARACAFITHPGFAYRGRLATPTLVTGPISVHAFALRLASFAFPGFAVSVTRSQRQVGYMFTGSYMIETFIQQGRSGFS